MSVRASRWVAAWVASVAGLWIVASTVGAAAPPDPNLVAAQAAATRILSLTPVPPGAAAQATDPSVGGSLSQVFHARGPQQIIRSQYWTMSGTPGTVSDYLFAHPPAGSRFDSEQGIGKPPPSVTGWQEERSFPGRPGRVTSELLEITTAPAGGGGTAIRADAMVIWRPTWEQIPASARAAHVKLDGFAQRTVTGAALARLRTLVNAEPVVAPGGYACPAGIAGQAIGVTFVDARGRALAHVASDSADGCRWLSFTAGAHRGPVLWGGWDLPPRLWAGGSLIHCTAAQLAVTVSSPSGSGTQGSATITVRNVARAPCTMRGAPSIELLTATGPRLPIGHTHVAGPASVSTAPGHGSLSAVVSWSARSRRCALPAPASAVIGVPGVRRRFDVTLTPSRRRLGPCTGRLAISPLAPGI